MNPRNLGRVMVFSVYVAGVVVLVGLSVYPKITATVVSLVSPLFAFQIHRTNKLLAKYDKVLQDLEDLDLKGQRVLITGATSGTTVSLTEKGLGLVLHDFVRQKVPRLFWVRFSSDVSL